MWAPGAPRPRAAAARGVDAFFRTASDRALRPRLVDQLMPARDLQRMLAAAGTPTRPEDIGLTLAELKDTFPKAMYYRSRYTVLDVTREIGWFDELVDEVFAPGGLWT